MRITIILIILQSSLFLSGQACPPYNLTQVNSTDSSIDNAGSQIDTTEFEFEYTIDSLSCNDFEGQIFVDITGEYENIFWIGPNQFFTNQQNPEIEYPGVYILIVTDSLGCETRDSVEISYTHSAFNMDILSTHIVSCNEPDTELVVSPGGNNFTYKWSKFNEISFTAPDNDTITVSDPGSYSVEITRNADNCTVREITRIIADTIPIEISFDPETVNSQNVFVFNCDLGISTTIISALIPGEFIVTSPNGLTLNPVFGNEYPLNVSEIGVYTIEFRGPNGCIDQLLLTTECYQEPFQCTGPTLYGNGTASFQNTDGPVIEELFLQFGDCENLCISLDVSTNGNQWIGTGNLETFQECDFGQGCIGDPFNSLAGDCAACWDFLYAQFQIGDSIVYQNMLGDDPSDPLDATWSIQVNTNDFPNISSVAITIIGQTFAMSENLTYSNLNVTCLQDSDNDGYVDGVDCNDTNPEINPGIEEICDGLDNDCDGQIDEGFLVILYEDIDNDGYGGGGGISVVSCVIIADYIPIGGDCDDYNPEINPAATEIANNEVDENCDGIILVIDEDNDGFNSDEDCNDMNPLINPEAEDSDVNGIDEDCDGIDGPSVISAFANEPVTFYPNPTQGIVYIETNKKSMNYQVYNVQGILIKEGKLEQKISLVYEEEGIYFIKLNELNSSDYCFLKIFKN